MKFTVWRVPFDENDGEAGFGVRVTLKFVLPDPRAWWWRRQLRRASLEEA